MRRFSPKQEKLSTGGDIKEFTGKNITPKSPKITLNSTKPPKLAKNIYKPNASFLENLFST